MQYTPSMQPETEISIGFLKARWNAERAIWLAHRATDRQLIAANAYMNLNQLMDVAVDLRLVVVPVEQVVN